MTTGARDAGPALQPVEMHLAMPASPATGTVIASTICTAGAKRSAFVRHVSIDVSGTPLAGRFRAGQSFGVMPPGLDSTGRAHKLRLYSIASPSQGEPGYPPGTVLATTVKRLIDEHHQTHKLFLGVTSNYLCDLEVGQSIQITGPSGKRFVLPADPLAHNYVFFATGTGIAPFRGMIGDLVAARAAATTPIASDSGRVTLVMGTPYATDLLYHEEFERIAAEHSWFRYMTAISRQAQPDGHGPLYVQQRLRTNRDEFIPFLTSSKTLIYVCGLTGMELGIFQGLSGILPEATLGQYLEVDPSVQADSGAWQRSMIHKQLKPTRRVFLEVYD